MNNRTKSEYYKKIYPPGTRVQLDIMGDDPNPIEPGTKGTVKFVDVQGTLHTIFDSGRFLGICPEVDSFHKINEQTESQADELGLDSIDTPHISM